MNTKPGQKDNNRLPEANDPKRIQFRLTRLSGPG